MGLPAHPFRRTLTKTERGELFTLPIEQSRPKHQGEPRCGGELAGLNLVFLVKRQLFAQEQHLGTQFRPRRDRQPQKLNALAGCNNKDREQ